MHHYVYQIISLSPNEEGVCRIYSGLRSCDCEPEEDDYMGSGIAIKNAIEKYGKDKFMKLIIAKFDNREAAHECETQWLEKQFKFHGSDWTKFNKFHYNLRLNEGFNDGFACSPETRAKISEANIGKQVSSETKKKMSEAQSGKNHPNFGKQLSEDTKKKLSESRIGEKNHKFKGFVIGTNETNQIIAFCGHADMKWRDFNSSHISAVINGRRPHHKGFTFTRSDDPIFLQQLLNEDNFVDEESKQIIQQFLNQ